MGRIARLTAGILLLAAMASAEAGKVLIADPVVSSAFGNGDGVKFILKYEAESRFGLALEPVDAVCGDVTCASRIGQAAGASKVVFAQVQKVGDGNYFALSSVDFSRNGKYSTAMESFRDVEELETAIPRAFDALQRAERASAGAAVAVAPPPPHDVSDNRRRAASTYVGFTMGMMYPLAGTYAWVEEKDVYDDHWHRLGTRREEKRIELSQWEFGVAAWLALNDDVAVTFDVAVRGPESGPGDYQIFFDVGAVRFLSDGDVSPFVGAGLGVHPGPADDNGRNDRKRYMGPALNLNAGVLFMRSYAFSLYLRGKYGVIFDSDMDQKISADIGLLWHKDDGASHSDVARANNSSIGGLAVLLVLCSIVSLAVGGRL